MSILCATSYFNGLENIPEIIKKLDQLLIEKNEKGFGIKDIQLAEHINNLIVKIGFIMIAKNYLKTSIKGHQAETNFFLSNFIYDSKAFLDATAMTLNHFFKLGFIRGDIDLKKKSFLERLKNNHLPLSNEIEKQQKWIDEVVKWRDEVIHRSSVASINFSPPDETRKKPKDNIVKMPSKPASIFDLIQASGLKNKQIGNQDIIQFCINWIDHAETMFNTILFFIEKDLKTRSNNPVI